MLKRLLFSFITLGASLSVMAIAPAPGRPVAGRANMPESAPAKMAAATATPKVVANPENVTDWVSRGTVKFKESYGMVGQCFAIDFGYIDVEIEESEANPGLYRVVNPYNGYVGTQLSQSEIDTSTDHYMIVDATDPQNVSIPAFDTGVIDDGKHIFGQSYSSGTVEEQVVSFPEWGLGYFYEGGAGNSGNWHGTFRLSLPGAKDYITTMTYDDIMPVDHVARYYVNAGRDVASLKYVVSNNIITDEALENLLEAEGKPLELGAESYSLNLDKSGYHQLLVGAYDADGNLQATAGMTFYRFDDDNDNWKSLGITNISENFAGNLWGYGAQSYGVEIQEHATQKGLYRLVNPYIPVTGEADHMYSTLLTDQNYYLYIDASDPEAAFFYESPIGSNEYYGNLVVISRAYYFMAHRGYSKESVAENNLFGYVENGVIKFPSQTAYQWIDGYQDNAIFWAGELIVPIPAEHTVTVSSADKNLGSVAIINPATEGNSITTTESKVTVKATPAEGCGFIAWSDAAGSLVSTDAEYTYFGTVDIALTAVFGYNVTVDLNGEGTYVLKNEEGTTLDENPVLLYGSKLTLTVTPTDELSVLDIDVNGTKYTTSPVEFTVTGPTAVTVNIIEKLFKLVVNVKGEGDVQVFTKGSDSEAPIAENVLMPGEDMPKGSTIRIFACPAPGLAVTAASVIPGNGAETPTTINTSRIAKCSWDESWYYVRGASSHQSKSDYVVNIEFGKSSSAIETIEADHAEAEYYNLQGIRVAADNLTSGFYILRQGDKTSKVYIVR